MDPIWPMDLNGPNGPGRAQAQAGFQKKRKTNPFTLALFLLGGRYVLVSEKTTFGENWDPRKRRVVYVNFDHFGPSVPMLFSFVFVLCCVKTCNE